MFEDAYGTATSGKFGPSARKKTVAKGDSERKDGASDLGFTGPKARATISCTDCGRPRFVYARAQLDKVQRAKLQTMIDEAVFTCGDTIVDAETASDFCPTHERRPRRRSLL